MTVWKSQDRHRFLSEDSSGTAGSRGQRLGRNEPTVGTHPVSHCRLGQESDATERKGKLAWARARMLDEEDLP